MNTFDKLAAAVSPRLALANPFVNGQRQAEAAQKAAADGCSLIVFPEMSLTGATCGDLYRSARLQKETDKALAALAEATAKLDEVIVTGLNRNGKSLAAVLYMGQLQLLEDGMKSSGLPFDFMVKIGNRQDANWTKTPLTVWLNAKPFRAGCGRMDLLMLAEVSKKTEGAVVYANAGCGESTMDDVYDGRCLLAENGNVIGDSGMLLREGACCTAAFGQNAPQPVLLKKPYEYAARDPFIPAGEEDAEEFCSEILQAQAVALAERLQRSYSGKAIIGVSGGSDSTLSILASARAMELLGKPSSDVLAVTMPGFGTSSRTKGNAYGMMEALGCEIREISIAASVAQHFKDIDHDINDHNVTYENAQARERTQILMDLANRDGGLVVGTGDMSEEALGWCTYNGDHMAMYNTNASLTKGLVKKVIAVAAKQLRSGTSPFSNEKDALKLAAALEDVLDTPVSPELLPTDENGQIAQKTEDKVGPYELHDFFLFHLVNDGMDPDDILDLAETAFAGSYDRATIAKWLKTFCRRFFTQQFKRNCAPEGAQLIAMSLSPRGAWAMPSDADGSLWLQLRE